MGISAITVSYRTGPVMRTCIAALLAAPDIQEIIVVDNGNPADDEAWLDQMARTRATIRVVRGQGNIGFGAASNLGARQALGAHVLFINPDVVLAPEAPSLMRAASADLAPVGIVGGDLRDPDGNPDRGSRRDAVTLWSAFVSFSGLSRLEQVLPMFRDIHRHRDPMPASAAPVANVSGAMMLMTRESFDTLGGFDEDYFLHVEDIDLCWRVHQAGGRVLFQPGAIGVHARSTSAAAAADVERHKASGFARYFRKQARSPLDRALAACAGRLLGVVLPARAATRTPA